MSDFQLEAIKSSVNDEKRSDCCFMVESKKIYAVKALLAVMSPVFDRMLYGELKEDLSKPIIVSDMTYLGFLEMIKYTHGFKISELNLMAFGETLIAANKYLIQPLVNDLMIYMRENVDEKNCLTFYNQILLISDQLMTSEESTETKKVIANFIQFNFRNVIKNPCLIEIEKSLLIEILQFKRLDVEEIEIVLLINKWIIAELNGNGREENEANKRQLFEQFINLIRFTDLQLRDVVDFDTVFTLLTKQELCALFKHLSIGSNGSFSIEYKSERQRGDLSNTNRSTSPISIRFPTNLRSANQRIGHIRFKLKADCAVNLISIQTTLSTDLNHLKLMILTCNGKQINSLNIRTMVVKNKLKFKFANGESLYMLENNCYTFHMSFDKVYFGSNDQLEYLPSNSYACTYHHRRHPVTFTISSVTDVQDEGFYHCLSSIEFNFLR